MPTIIIENGMVVLPDRLLKNTPVFISGDKIRKRLLRSARNDEVITIDARGLFVSPGFIDSHIHGSPSDIIVNETKYGTTAFVVAVSCGETVPGISGYENALGVRLEGPYINKKMAGAQSKRFISSPSVKGLEKILKQGRGAIKMVTLAPELKGASGLIKTCIKHNVLPSLGHSDANYSEAQKAFSLGIRHITHIFNAVSGPRHGSAGASMAAVFDKRVTTEVIADMKHVRIEPLDSLFALKDCDKIILVTDSVRAKSSGHKEGSRLTMIGAVKNVVTRCGVDIACAVRMASANPARLFGVWASKGSLAPGKDADIVIFDKNFDVKMTMIRGIIVYRSSSIVCR